MSSSLEVNIDSTSIGTTEARPHLMAPTLSLHDISFSLNLLTASAYSFLFSYLQLTIVAMVTVATDT